MANVTLEPSATGARPRIAVIGRTEMLYQAAIDARAAGFDIVAIFTAEPSPESTVGIADFRALAEECGAVFLAATRLDSQAGALLRESRPDVAISMNWPTMMRAHITDAVRCGVINAHGSDLPRYRGNACPNWAIINGEAQIGLTFHLIDPNGLDTGDVISKSFIDNRDDLYIGEVYDWLRTEIPAGLVRAAKLLLDPSFKPSRQDETLALRGYPRRTEDGKMNFQLSSQTLLRLVRASSKPFAGAFCADDAGRKVIVWRASLVDIGVPFLAMPGQVMAFDKEAPIVACGEGALRFDELEIVDGGKLSKSLRGRFS